MPHNHNKLQQALALHQAGRLQEAEQLYRTMVQAQPDQFDALHMLGVIAYQTGNHRQAAELIGRALAIEPNNATAHSNLGVALNNLQQHQAAIESFDQAIALRPDYADAHTNRANALNKLKQYQAALQSCDQAIAIQPDYAGAHNNRGVALYGLAQLQAAIASYDRAIAIKPDYAGAYNNRGVALADLRQHEDALASFEKAAVLQPDHEYLSGQLLHSKMHLCDWRGLQSHISKLLAKIERHERVTPAFPVLSVTASPALQRQAAELWVNDKHPVRHSPEAMPNRSRTEKIRLGYFSMDFREHPVSYLTAELFETHDRDKFEVYAFSYGVDTKDEMRTRLEAAFDKFIDVREKSDTDIAALARQMQIDIAIDLAGLTGGARTGIFALRAAPVQVNYLGYPGTMGADFMDYLIADKQLIPEHARHHYAEKIAYLPNSYMASDSKRKISSKVFGREELGLPQTGFVFCCFNSSYKITPSTFDVWMRILKKVDGSVLWLSENNPTANANLRQEALNRGIDPQRLVFAPRMPLVAEHLARHRAADLFLDTLPYNAHTTASDALWAGLPVLTCMGESFASRVAASLLSALDLPELITQTQEEYEALAIELASKPEQLSAIKQKLDRNRLTKPLFDTPLFTRHIEDAYTQMVKY